jgi:catechol 2,3-dioxygenase-like lactoylglutathione lyase family enzyme
MALSLHASFLNVSDVERSIEFYRAVLQFDVVARDAQAAILMVTQEPQPQALVLREVGRHPYYGGSSTIGPVLLSFEAGSRDEFEDIAKRFAELDSIAGRHHAEGWEAFVGQDPDRIQIVVSVSTTGSPIRIEDWGHLDEIVYSLGP